MTPLLPPSSLGTFGKTVPPVPLSVVLRRNIRKGCLLGVLFACPAWAAPPVGDVYWDIVGTSVAIGVLVFLGAYLIGSLSFAVIISRLMKLPDPHSYGSGNPGATNVLRTGRKLAALLTLLGDTLKAVAVMLVVGKKLNPELSQLGIWIPDLVWAAALLGVVAGHLWPVFFKFKGGKGVATAAGALIVLDWRIGSIVIGAWLLTAILTRLSSLAALIAIVSTPLLSLWFLDGHRILHGALMLLSALMLWRHCANIQRLLRGEEGRIGQKAKPTTAAPVKDPPASS